MAKIEWHVTWKSAEFLYPDEARKFAEMMSTAENPYVVDIELNIDKCVRHVVYRTHKVIRK